MGQYEIDLQIDQRSNHGLDIVTKTRYRTKYIVQSQTTRVYRRCNNGASPPIHCNLGFCGGLQKVQNLCQKTIVGRTIAFGRYKQKGDLVWEYSTLHIELQSATNVSCILDQVEKPIHGDKGNSRLA